MSHSTRITPVRGGQQGRHCPECGLPLVEYSVVDGFDRKTGQTLYERRKECPLVVFGKPQP